MILHASQGFPSKEFDQKWVNDDEKGAGVSLSSFLPQRPVYFSYSLELWGRV